MFLKKNVVVKLKTHMLCSVQFFENRNIYEILCKNIVEPGRSQYDACLLHAGYLRLQIHTQNVIIFFFTATMVARNRQNVTIYACPCLVLF